MPRPLIGITLDWQKEGSFSARPHYALRERWFEAVYRAGGLPVGIPHIKEAISEYFGKINGLLVPGGEFALPEEWYVQSSDPMPYHPSPRSAFDRTILEMALKKDIPILGVCAGMQFLGCIKGCRMTRNVQAYFDTTINHWDEQPTDKTAHAVHVTQNTLLSNIIKCDSFEVNTHHREGIVEVPDHVKVNAVSPDGVIEGIELPGYRFALGVQWHPEYEITTQDKAIIHAFITAASS